jgi:hypothetical protein
MFHTCPTLVRKYQFDVFYWQITFTPWELQLSDRLISTWTHFMTESIHNLGVAGVSAMDGDLAWTSHALNSSYLHIHRPKWTQEVVNDRSDACDFWDRLQVL